MITSRVRQGAAIGALLLVLLAGFLASAAWARWGWGGAHARIVFKGEKVKVQGSAVAACRMASGEAAGAGPVDSSCRVIDDADAEGRPAGQSIVFARAGIYSLEVRPGAGAGGTERVTVASVPMYTTAPAFAAMAFLVLFGPALLGVATGRRFGWMTLLTEPNGGLSLGKLQLALWWAPAITLIAGVFAVKLDLASVPPTYAVLLGLSGATTALAAAANPRSAFTGPTLELAPPSAYPKRDSEYAREGGVARTPGASPAFTDLVEDWQSQGDFSRYQYLLLSAVGSASILVAFVLEGRLAEVPKEFIALLGASQATYLGTKAVKSTKTAQEAAAP